MNMLTRNQLEALARLEGEACVSIFQPTVGGSRADRQDAVRLRNLLRRAGAALAGRGLGADAVAELLGPGERLLSDPDFVAAPAGGFALFLAPGFARPVRTDFALPERVEVGGRFVIRPLLPLLERAELWYALAVSLNRVRLLEVTLGGFRALAPADLPADFEAAMGVLQYDSAVSAHSTARAATGRRSLMYHGHGDGDEENLKDDVTHFLRRVVEAVERELGDSDAPVVVAAVEAWHPLFERANRRLHLVRPGLCGNPDLASDADFVECGRKRLSEAAGARAVEVAARWHELRKWDRSAADFADVVRAADQGRVEALILAREPEVWGTYEPDLARVVVHPRREPEDLDLLDFAAARTLVQGGEVHAVEGVVVPEARVAVATLRYPAPAPEAAGVL